MNNAKTIYYRLILLSVVLLAFGKTKAQTIESLLSAYDAKVPQEKIHIHFDNSMYTPGQTVWYKAYLLKGNEASDLSKNLYIDWFDEKGKYIDHVVAPIAGSGASGSFTLPKNYAGDHILVLAYTKWMLNFDSAFLFHKTIPVIQTIASLQNVKTATVTTLRFFPEGGELVENVPSIISFKAQLNNGVPVTIDGIVTNKNGKQVAVFSSVHNGMGKISLTPLPGENYTAEWTDNTGSKRYTALPAAKTNGVVLTVNNTAIDPLFTIERSANASEHFTKGMIVAQMNQRIVFRAGIDLSSRTKVNGYIPATSFPSGILQLTLFNEQQQPLAERICFINNDNYSITANLYTDTINLAKRGKNIYQIEIPDSIGTSLSLAITDGEIRPDSATNIISQFLLSGEIKGYVHDPAYYFSSSGDSVKEQLDLVMLTNGWRRFIWDDVWAGKTPVLNYPPDTNYISIQGKINGVSDRQAKKAESVNMILMAKDSSRQYVFTPLHEDGSFSENNLIFFDTTTIFYQLNRSSESGKNQVTIHASLFPSDSMRVIRPLPSLFIDTSSLVRVKQINNEQRRLDSLKNKTTLSEVTVTTKRKTRMEQLDDKYATGQFSEHSSAIYEFNVIDDEKANTGDDIFDYLKGKVPGLSINTAQRTPTIGRTMMPAGAIIPFATIGRKSVKFLVDEEELLPPGNPDPGEAIRTLRTILVKKIAYIKVFPSFGAGADRGAIVAIYLKKGKDQNVLFNTPLSSTTLIGYTPVKEFYLPANDEQPVNANQLDLRRTVYWKPNLYTSATNSKLRISFYNNDISHSLRIILEGIAADGRLIHFSKLLQ